MHACCSGIRVSANIRTLSPSGNDQVAALRYEDLKHRSILLLLPVSPLIPELSPTQILLCCVVTVEPGGLSTALMRFDVRAHLLGILRAQPVSPSTTALDISPSLRQLVIHCRKASKIQRLRVQQHGCKPVTLVRFMPENSLIVE